MVIIKLLDITVSGQAFVKEIFLSDGLIIPHFRRFLKPCINNLKGVLRIIHYNRKG
jgi:hypothetical protein